MQKGKFISTAVLGRPSIVMEGISVVLNRCNFRIKLKYNKRDQAFIAKLVRSRSALCLVVGDPVDASLGTFVRDLRAASPACCIVVLSDDCSNGMLDSLLIAGASGWLPLTIAPEGLVDALRLIVSNQVSVAVLRSASLAVGVREEPTRRTTLPLENDQEQRPVALAPEAGPMQRLAALSEREKSVLDRLLKGESNKHIARALLISEATVKIHVRALLKKIGAENRTQAAIWALRGSPSSRDPDGLNGSALKN